MTYTDDELSAILGGRKFSLQFDENGHPVFREVTEGGTSAGSGVVDKALRRWMSRWLKNSSLMEALSKIYSEEMHNSLSEYLPQAPVKIETTGINGYREWVKAANILYLFDEYRRIVDGKG